MTTIGRVNIIPLKGIPVSATAIRAQIAEVRYQGRIGIISEEEASAKIQMLESKLDEIENLSITEIKPQQQETIVEAPLPEINEDFEKERECLLSENDYLSQQAQYNRAFHNI